MVNWKSYCSNDFCEREKGQLSVQVGRLQAMKLGNTSQSSMQNAMTLKVSLLKQTQPMLTKSVC
jgi:hypothetical protein